MPCTTKLVDVPIKVHIPPKIVTYERGIRNLVAGNCTDFALTSGTGYYFCGGKYQKIQWKKGDVTEPLQILDENGQRSDGEEDWDSERVPSCASAEV